MSAQALAVGEDDRILDVEVEDFDDGQQRLDTDEHEELHYDDMIEEANMANMAGQIHIERLQAEKEEL